MKNFVLYIFLLLYWLLPLAGSGETGWIPEQLESLRRSVDYNEQSLYLKFETTVPVSVECNYPHLNGGTPLIDYANKKLEVAANTFFEEFVESERGSQEKYNNDFGGCYLDYQLIPIYCLPSLISVYGSESQSRDCPHGWTHHEGKNFWKNENIILEISINDLFIPESDWCNFLIRYCDNYFKSLNYGYYGQLSDLTHELKPEHFNTFLITDQGIMIVFPSYVLGGWADGPDLICIPYRDLCTSIDPTGPLKDIPEINRMLSNSNI